MSLRLALPAALSRGMTRGTPRRRRGYNLRKMPMGAVYKEYGLDPMTVDFIGHAIALHRCATCPLRGSAALLHALLACSLHIAILS